MSSKKENKFSITTRLTFFYSCTTILLVSLFAIFLYGTMIHILHNGNYQFLSSEVDIIAKVLNKNKVNNDILEHKIVEVPHTKTGSVYHYYIRLLDENNRVVIETPHMETFFQNTRFFDNLVKPNTKKTQWWTGTNKQKYILIKSPVFNKEKQRMWQVQIALDISYQQNKIHYGYFIIISCLSVVTLLAILFGYYIAKKGMRSLYELTEATKNMTATSLHQKISPDSWPAELHALGAAFNNMLERIEFSFSQLEQFSSDLAHELRTPINNIMGQTEIALSIPRSSLEYQQLLGSNLEELNRISQIIENLLFLARTENSAKTIDKSVLNVNEEIKLICEYYQAIADEKNIKLTHSGKGIVLANSTMFRRMISNLVSNALNYTLSHGAVQLNISQTIKHTEIKIRDTGIGIAKEHLSNIFNRFYRVDSARSQYSGGTGLGLAIVKSIVELHGGTIEIESKIKEGTSINIIIPHPT